jgi:hypothetical protein
VILTATLSERQYGVTIDVYLVADIERYSPIADAGNDQSLQCGEPAVLDGTASADIDGTIASYTWYTNYKTPDQEVVAIGPNTRATLPQGLQSVTMVVADDDRLFGVDTITVDVGTDAEPPLVESGPPLDLVYGEIVKDYFEANGYGAPAPESTSITLADCVGDDYAEDQCAGALSLVVDGTITRVEMRVPKTSENARAHERKVKMLLRHPFFKEPEYKGFAVTDSTSIELPIGQPPLPSLDYRVFFEVSDPSENTASGSCDVRLSSELTQDPPAVDPESTCVLCIGRDCPSHCMLIQEGSEGDAGAP